MKLKQLTFLFLFFCPALVFSSPGYSANEIDIELKQLVEIDKEYFYLKDISRFNTNSPEIELHLGKIKIGLSPKPGFSKSYSSEDIERVILGEPQLADIKLNWSENKNVKLKARGKQYYLSDFDTQIKSQLLEQLTVQDDGATRFEINNIDLKKSLYLPYGDVETKIAFSANKLIRKNMPVLVDFYVEGKKVKTLAISYQLKAIRPVYIAKQDLKRRQNLNLSDFIVVEKDITNIYRQIAVPQDISVNRILINNKEQGSVLTKTDIVEKPAILKGERVSVNVFSSKIVIRSQAYAQNDANIGDLLILKNNRGSLYEAVVVEEGVANVY